ncbi:MAG TPA: NUDIX hydrolase, partial [Telluria sp.]
MTEQVFHPHADERGNPVRLARPSLPSDQAAWDEPERTATVIPLGELPTVLLGIPLLAWTGLPADDAGWNAVEGQASIDEPPFIVPAHKAAAAGVVIEEADGRLWLVSPSNQF